VSESSWEEDAAVLIRCVIVRKGMKFTFGISFFASGIKNVHG